MEEKAQGGERIDSTIPSLVFLGTPAFAVPSLTKLLQLGAEVKLVVCQPDRPKGRGMRLAVPPVKEHAALHGIPIFQPLRIRDRDTIDWIHSFKADCAVVVAYGQILPQLFLDGFPLGAVNVHASLLPDYRGAAPIQRSMLAGEVRTGVTIMLMDAGMDTGPVLAQQEIPIHPEDNFLTLHDRLAHSGAELLCTTLKQWRQGAVVPRPQNDELATYAPPISKGEQQIVWSEPAHRIVNRIRAFDPTPGAFAWYRRRRLKLFKGSLLPFRSEGKPGEILGLTEKGLTVLGGDNLALAVGELQLEGQRRLAAEEFLRGRSMPAGTVIE